MLPHARANARVDLTFRLTCEGELARNLQHYSSKLRAKRLSQVEAFVMSFFIPKYYYHNKYWLNN